MIVISSDVCLMFQSSDFSNVYRLKRSPTETFARYEFTPGIKGNIYIQTASVKQTVFVTFVFPFCMNYRILMSLYEMYYFSTNARLGVIDIMTACRREQAVYYRYSGLALGGATYIELMTTYLLPQPSFSHCNTNVWALVILLHLTVLRATLFRPTNVLFQCFESMDCVPLVPSTV